MAEGGFDLCECIYNHQAAMQRLLRLLQDSQDACTDSECIDGTMPEGAQGTNMLTMVFVFFLFAAVMFLTRPNSLRSSEPSGKPTASDQAPPPAPQPPAPTA